MSALDHIDFKGTRVLVFPIVEKSESKIAVPDSAKPQMIKVEIIKIGDGKDIIPGLKIGDVVFIERRVGTPMMIEDKAYLVINGSSDIIATV